MAITRAPTSAPYGLPMVPRMTAANSGSSRNQPISGRSWAYRPYMTPLAPARPPTIGQSQDEQLVGKDVDAAEQLDRRPGPSRVEEREVGTPAEVDDAPQQQGRAEGSHGQDDRSRPPGPQMAVDGPVEDYRDDSGQHHRDDQAEQELVTEGERCEWCALWQQHHHDQRDVGAGGHKVALREVRHLHDSGYQRQADGAERDDAGEHDAAHQQ